MNDIIIMDACALIAVLANEEGAEVVRSTIQKAANDEVAIFMNKVNLLEVYYDVFRKYGVKAATDFLEEMTSTPIQVISELTDGIFAEAGRLKATYKVSLADSIALAETSIAGGLLLTSDHHEFDAIERTEKIKLYWIR